jgi:hypothetical protein
MKCLVFGWAAAGALLLAACDPGVGAAAAGVAAAQSARQAQEQKANAQAAVKAIEDASRTRNEAIDAEADKAK